MSRASVTAPIIERLMEILEPWLMNLPNSVEGSPHLKQTRKEVASKLADFIVEVEKNDVSP